MHHISWEVIFVPQIVMIFIWLTVCHLQIGRGEEKEAKGYTLSLGLRLRAFCNSFKKGATA